MMSVSVETGMYSLPTAHLFHSTSEEGKLGIVFGKTNAINVSLVVGNYSLIFVGIMAFKVLSFVH
jgi:hypothetical protein